MCKLQVSKEKLRCVYSHCMHKLHKLLSFQTRLQLSLKRSYGSSRKCQTEGCVKLHVRVGDEKACFHPQDSAKVINNYWDLLNDRAWYCSYCINMCLRCWWSVQAVHIRHPTSGILCGCLSEYGITTPHLIVVEVRPGEDVFSEEKWMT